MPFNDEFLNALIEAQEDYLNETSWDLSGSCADDFVGTYCNM